MGQEPLTGGLSGSAPLRPRPSARPLSTLPPAFVETSDGLSIPDEPFQEPPLALVNRSALRIVTLPAVLDLLSQQEDALPCFEDSCSDDDFVSQHAHLVYATSGESPPNLPCPQRQTSESDSDEGDKGPLMTRQQQKALDRELPWRTILSKDKSYVAEFEKAIKKEETSWRDWGSVRPLTPQEVKQVMTDPVLRKRIIPSRAVYRDKNIGVPPLKAKCRVVAAGFKDPDLAQLPRFAPTASRVAFHTVLQVASTGQLEDPPWKLASADVSTAFLQGKGSDRQLPLYLRTPQDGLIKTAGFYAVTSLLEVTGNIYGLISAPAEWAREVDLRLQANGFTPHSLDPMLFISRSSDGALMLVLCVHVDDFLLTWHPDYDVESLKKLFTFGSWEEIDRVSCKSLTFTGKEIRFRTDGSILVSQETFIADTAVRKIPAGRLNQPPELTPQERSEFRSVTGCCQWVATSSRPDLAAVTSLAQSGQPTIHDLKALYAAVKHLHATPTKGVLFRPLPWSNLTVVAYGDSSWANAPDLRSQTGYVVCLTTNDALTGRAPASVFEWKSQRTRRVVRSTLAAEACASDAAADCGHYVSVFLAELIEGTGRSNDPSRFPLFVATDCRSLYDAITLSTASLQEKRTAIDISAIRYSLKSGGGIRWVPTTEQWADALTKDSAALRATFLRWLDDPFVALRDPEDPSLSAGLKL